MPMLRLTLAVVLLLIAPLGCFGGAPPDAADSLGESSQALTGSVHEVSFNVVKTLAVKTGDTIRLSGFPTGWTYTSVEVNFDGSPESMDLTVAENGASYGVTGWSDRVIVPYRAATTQELVVTRGSGTIRVHFWVSSEPSSPAEDAQQGPEIRELAASGTPLALTTMSGVFRIGTLPSTTYNVVVVRLEPRDGQALNGQLSAGGSVIQLSGSSQRVLFKERGNLPLVFDLTFPSVRQIAITWSVENRVPEAKVVARTTSVSGTTVVAKYGFTQDHAVDQDLSLSFRSADFIDGAVPTVKRLAHNPQGVRNPNRPDDLFGPTYDIHARPKAGQRIQVALPVPEIATLRGIDETDITILHHDAASNTWSEIVPDRIANGYVYFTTDSFSSFLSRMKKRLKKAATATLNAVGGAAIIVAETVVTVADGIKDGIKEAYAAIVSGACSLLELSTYKSIFYDRPRFQASPPNLSSIVASADFSETALEALDDANLTPVAQAAVDPFIADHLEEWRASKRNAEILLADLLLTAKGSNGRSRRFEPIPVAAPAPAAGWAPAYVIRDRRTMQVYPSLALFRFTSPLLAAAPRALQMLQECDGVFGLADEFKHTAGHVVDFVKKGTKLDLGGACREALMLPADLVDWATPDVLTCGIEAGSFASYAHQKNLGSYWAIRDALVLDASGFLNVASVLFWADPRLRAVWELNASGLRDQLHSFVGLTHEAYSDNNIVIKSMAGVALWDMVSKGEKATYDTLKKWLEAKSGSGGGYAEGTGYLQYVNQDVPYLLAAMTRSGFISRGELPPKYLKTGEWLLNAMPLKGFDPVEVDDGLTHAPDFLIYSFLNQDLRYQVFSKDYNPNTISAALRPLGFTDVAEQRAMKQSAPPALPDTYFSDGIGVVRAGSGGQQIALSIVAESGDMRVRGAGHDQQDNGSVTLTHATLGPLILDAGYDGFDKRLHDPCAPAAPCAFARFDSHNVVMTEASYDFHGEAANPQLTFGDLARVLANQPSVHNLDFLDSDFAAAGKLTLEYLAGGSLDPILTWGTLRAGWAIYRDQAVSPATDFRAGGADASLTSLINDVPGAPVHGLEVVHTSTAGVTNHRLLASYAGHMWIIDRPEAKQSLWSRTNWAASGLGAGKYASAFQIPKAPDAGDRLVTFLQHDSPARAVQQRTHRAGSATEAPVFVTGFPNDGSQSSFMEVACQGAKCMQRTTPQGDDLVIVPHWGQAFDDCRFFQGLVRTGQVVFAHKDAGSSTWKLRLVGKEATSMAGSLGAQTGYAADAVYQLGPGTTFQSTYPNGAVVPLSRGVGQLDDFTEHTFSRTPTTFEPDAFFQVERDFGRPIQSIKVTIVAGDADDVGFVGTRQVTSTAVSCGGPGSVTAPVDVTSEVTLTGSSARLVLRAQDRCFGVVGWGSATGAGRADARLRWEVTFADGC
jgi:hypothetical protein